MPKDESTTLPTRKPAQANPELSMSLLGRNASPALQLMLDPALFDRAMLMAKLISQAAGMTPDHLTGNQAACFAIVTRSLTWKLDPFAVAQSTYMVHKKVGYEGKLCQAILENSGKLEGPVTYEHYGDWDKIQGNFKIIKSGNDKEYATPTWTDEDAREGKCGVLVSAKVIGELEPRTLPFDLIQAWPRNSTLWATDPKTQICYTAVRRFASVCAPGLFMGVPFDRDEVQSYQMKNITPSARPQAEDFETTDYPDDIDDGGAETVSGKTTDEAEAVTEYSLIDDVGEVVGDYPAKQWIDESLARMKAMTDAEDLAAFVNNNSEMLAVMDEDGHEEYTHVFRHDANAYAKHLVSDKESGDKDTPVSAGVEAGGPDGDGAAGPPDDAAPEPPSEFVWISGNGKRTPYGNISDWTDAVCKTVMKAKSLDALNAAKAVNAETMAQYHALGNIYSAAVEMVETAIEATKDALES